MSVRIELDEATAANRRVPMKLFTSNGTSPDTGASDDSIVLGINSAGTIIPDVKLAAIESAAGMYYVELSQSNVSVAGVHPIYHTQGSFHQHVATLEVVNNSPYSTQSNLDLSDNTIAGDTNTATLIGALNDIDGSEVTLHAGTHSGATVAGLVDASTLTIAGTTNTATLIGALNDIDGSEVTLHAGTHSGATVAGLVDASTLTIAGTTNTATLIGALNDIDGSEVTLHAGTHSGATIDGVLVTTTNTDMVGTDGANTTVPDAAGTAAALHATTDALVEDVPTVAEFEARTIAAADYFDPAADTVATVTALESAVTLAGGTYSNVTVQINNISSLVTLADGGITAAKFGAAAIDAAALATDANEEIADSVLSRNIAGGGNGSRTVGAALQAIRNRAQLSETSFIVYQADDTNIAWHASLTTTAANVFPTDVNPA